MSQPTPVTEALSRRPVPEPVVNLDEAVFVLSSALDYVGVDDVQHGKRVAAVALATAEELGWDEATLHDLYQASLLHDIGVSSTRMHNRLIQDLEWQAAKLHCDLGAGLLQDVPPLAHLAAVVRYHHTRWEKLVADRVATPVARMANLVYLADRIDAVRARHRHDADHGVSAALTMARERAGVMFEPALVDALHAATAAPGFWDALAPAALEEHLQRARPGRPDVLASLADIRALAHLFAHVVDAKSPFTARHSEGVAALASHLARRAGMSEDRRELLDIAALLHDLGKLRVPDEILDKAAPLDAEEWAVMRRHAWDSFEILGRVEGFGAIAHWAGLHHETPVGDGYPEVLRGARLPLEARIISVADVFQALAQDRPYRKGLAPPEILAILKQDAARGHLAPEIVALVEQDVMTCWRHAVRPEIAEG